jgi:hypothetical protein
MRGELQAAGGWSRTRWWEGGSAARSPRAAPLPFHSPSSASTILYLSLGRWRVCLCFPLSTISMAAESPCTAAARGWQGRRRMVLLLFGARKEEHGLWCVATSSRGAAVNPLSFSRTLTWNIGHITTPDTPETSLHLDLLEVAALPYLSHDLSSD